MAKKSNARFGLEFMDLDNYMDDMKKLDVDINKAVEQALIKSHDYITPLLEKKVEKSNLPAHGKYSTKDRSQSKKQIIRDKNIEWDGSTCTIDIGFNLDETIVPIFLIRGSSGHYNPVTGLKALLEGKTTQDKISEIQENVIIEAIQKKLGGN